MKLAPTRGGAALALGLSCLTLAGLALLTLALRAPPATRRSSDFSDVPAALAELRRRGLEFRCQSDMRPLPDGGYEVLAGGATLIAPGGEAVYLECADREHFHPRAFAGPPAERVGRFAVYGDADFARQVARALGA
jgi:hypothetical protein